MPHEQICRPPKRRWPLPREKWLDYARLSRLLPVVVMLTIALCFSSCATTQKTQTQQEQISSTSAKSDTTAAVTRVITTQMVPESQVHMAISVDSLLKLPEGAAYRENKDRAHVEATHHDGIIYITGTCDSLQRQVEYYEALYHNARDALENYHESVIEERASRKSPFSIYMSGVTCGFILTIALIYFLNFKITQK